MWLGFGSPDWRDTPYVEVSKKLPLLGVVTTLKWAPVE